MQTGGFLRTNLEYTSTYFHETEFKVKFFQPSKLI